MIPMKDALSFWLFGGWTAGLVVGADVGVLGVDITGTRGVAEARALPAPNTAKFD